MQPERNTPCTQRRHRWASGTDFARGLRWVLMCLAVGAWASAAPAAQPATAWRDAVSPGSVILFRHAIAPGGGDPAGFRLSDCATQRVLSTEGREQARRMGQQLRNAGVSVEEVWTSQWCRTRETAKLAFPGLRVVDQPAFNSFFSDPSQTGKHTAQALSMLQAWRGPGVLAVTTHQVNITALTGITPSSGEGIVVRTGPEGLRVLGHIPPPDATAP